MHFISNQHFQTNLFCNIILMLVAFRSINDVFYLLDSVDHSTFYSSDFSSSWIFTSYSAVLLNFCLSIFFSYFPNGPQIDLNLHAESDEQRCYWILNRKKSKKLFSSIFHLKNIDVSLRQTPIIGTMNYVTMNFPGFLIMPILILISCWSCWNEKLSDKRN